MPSAATLLASTLRHRKLSSERLLYFSATGVKRVTIASKSTWPALFNSRIFAMSARGLADP
jgi:hypothetical protein